MRCFSRWWTKTTDWAKNWKEFRVFVQHSENTYWGVRVKVLVTSFLDGSLLNPCNLYWRPSDNPCRVQSELFSSFKTSFQLLKMKKFLCCLSWTHFSRSHRVDSNLQPQPQYMGQTLNKVSYQGTLQLHFWNDATKTFIFELCQSVTWMLIVKIKKTSWKDITETFWLLNWRIVNAWLALRKNL